MTNALKDWQKHVAHRDQPHGVPEKALCGADLRFADFYLTGFAHAVNCIVSGDRLQPCPKCWAAVLDAPELFASDARL